MKALGGVNADSLQIKLPEPRKCCCWGTPIGDKLLMLAEDLDPKGNTLLAQLEAHGRSQAEMETEIEAWVDASVTDVAAAEADADAELERERVAEMASDAVA